MVKVDAGSYVVGKDPADGYHIAPQEIALNEFWIDQYQTTNAEYEQYLLANPGVPPPLVWPAAPKHPVRGVTWDQADAYCKWNNKRLPKEAEWEAAGRGPGKDPPLFPWGDAATAGGATLKLPQENTYEVGTQLFNKSPFGVFDMLGNVWEWVGEPYNSIPAGERILHGTAYGNISDLAFRLRTAADDPTYVRLAGFRCAADQVQ
jgi:formylglycine-generating enzyme required for sulfatase activity